MQNCSKNAILYWIDQINNYLRSVNFMIDPLPEIIIVDGSEQPNEYGDVLISTGGYQPESKMLFLYTSNRHLKDILRSYCHEIVHHNQNLDNGDYLRRVYKGGDLVDSPELEELEADAYLRGNLNFRKFTEKLKRDCKKSYQMRQ